MSPDKPAARRGAALALAGVAFLSSALALATGEVRALAAALLLGALASTARTLGFARTARVLGSAVGVTALVGLGAAPGLALALAAAGLSLLLAGRRASAFAGCVCSAGGLLGAAAHIAQVRAGSDLGRVVLAGPFVAAGTIALGSALLVWALPPRVPRRVRARQLRRGLLWTSVGGPIVFAFLGAAVAAMPLYGLLDESERQRLQSAADARARAVGAALEEALADAQLVASRTYARLLLEGLTTGIVDRQTAVEETANILDDALRSREDILSIIRLEADGSVLTSVGEAVPKELIAEAGLGHPEACVRGPILTAGGVVVASCAPIVSEEEGRIGTDLLIIDAAAVGAALGTGLELGSTCDVRLMPVPGSSLAALAVGPEGLTRAGAYADSPSTRAVARSPVQGGQLEVVASIDADELSSNVHARLAETTWLLLLLGVLVGGAAWFLLRPLASGVLFHSEELEREVDRKTAALQQKAADLERSNRDLEQFAYSASHDLQEPLKLIGGFVQLLERRYADRLDDEGREFLGYVSGGASRMQELVQDLLAYSRVGRLGEDVESVDWGALLDEVEVLFAEELAESGAVLLKGELPVTPGVTILSRQLLQNLIGNALKYRSEAPPRIEVSARAIDGGWEFAVQDNGIGIDPRFAERIFQVFERLHGRDQYSGTGIGLALCKRIVEQSGGRIWVESEPGKGTTIRFTVCDADGPVSQSL